MIVNTARPAMMPAAIDSTGNSPTFVKGDVVLVEVFAERVVFEICAGPVPRAGPPSIEIMPFDDAPVKVRVRFAPLIETCLAGKLIQLPPSLYHQPRVGGKGFGKVIMMVTGSVEFKP
jgi:hypothetical protein